jgi:hypothetical protein
MARPRRIVAIIALAKKLPASRSDAQARRQLRSAAARDGGVEGNRPVKDKITITILIKRDLWGTPEVGLVL